MAEQIENPPADLDVEEKRFIENKAKEYRMQGSSDEEADKMATEDWKKEKDNVEAANSEVWEKITKKINLHTFLDDQIRRALGKYKNEFHKNNKVETIDFRLTEGNIGGVHGKGIVAGAYLQLEYARNGNWKVFRRKEVKFTHIKDMRLGHIWKLELYEAMLHDVFNWGMTYCIHLDKYNEQQSLNKTVNTPQ